MHYCVFLLKISLILIQRCLDLTGGAQTSSLITIASSKLSDVYSATAYAITQLRTLCGVLYTSTSTTTTSSTIAPDVTNDTTDSTHYDDASTMDTTALAAVEAVVKFDWAFLQGSLQVLHTVGTMCLEFEQLERGIVNSIGDSPLTLLEPLPAHHSICALQSTLLQQQQQQQQHSNSSNSTSTLMSSDDAVAVLQGLLARSQIDNTNIDSSTTSSSGSSSVRESQLKQELRAVVALLSNSAVSGEVMPTAFRELQTLTGVTKELVFDLCFSEVSSTCITSTSYVVHRCLVCARTCLCRQALHYALLALSKRIVNRLNV